MQGGSPAARESRIARAACWATLWLAPSVMGVLLVLLLTRHGIGVSPDSCAYLGAARTFAAGEGFGTPWQMPFVNGHPPPMTHYPPGYPALVGLVTILGLDVFTAARILNCLFFATGIVLVGAIVRRHLGTGSWGMPLAAMLLAAFAEDMLYVHSMAWSEPSFVVLAMGGLLLLAMYLRENRDRLLLASAGLVGLAFLCRYVGGSLVACGVLSLAFLGQRPFRRKVIDIVLFTGISCLPMALWFLRNVYLTHSAADRSFMYHPLTYSNLHMAYATVTRWALIERLSPEFVFGLFGGVAAMVIIALGAASRRNAITVFGLLNRAPIPMVFAIFAGCYAGLMLTATMWFDAGNAYDGRRLLPLLVCGIVPFACLLDSCLKPFAGSVQLRRRLRGVVCTCVVVIYAARAGMWAKNSTLDTRWYSGNKAWMESPTVRYVAALPLTSPVFTNAPEALCVRGRPSYLLPWSDASGGHNRDQETERMRDLMKNEGGRLVYFNGVRRGYFFTPVNELVRRFELQLIIDTGDGAVYGVAAPHR